MGKKFIFALIFLGILYFSLSLYQLWQTHLPLVSPVDLIESLPPLAPIFRKPGNKIVFGFLPYWNMKYSDQLNVRSLTHLAYFGIDLNEDGSLKKYDKPKEKEPGWNKLNGPDFAILSRQIKILGKKLILVVRAMDGDQIETLLNSDSNRQNAINTIISVMTEKNFDGINLDFEYMGYPDRETRDNYTKFVTDISSKCKMLYEKCEISLDVFADSAIKNRLYDLKALTKSIDLVVVMAYDFFRPSSVQSGPVAPLRGKCSAFPSPNLGEGGTPLSGGGEVPCLDYDVVTSISDIAKLIPSYKILLGIPFYGYEWQTVNAEFLSRTYPKTGGLATYKRIRDLLADLSVSSLSATWSGITFTPYLSYIENGNTYQIHYEDENSLKLKIDFIHQAKLTGVAIWALGYELPYDSLWQTIANNL